MFRPQTSLRKRLELYAKSQLPSSGQVAATIRAFGRQIYMKVGFGETGKMMQVYQTVLFGNVQHVPSINRIINLFFP